MAENIPDLSRDPKHRAYPELFAYIVATLAGIDDDIAGMATISAMIHHSFRYLWTGFYRVVEPNLLRVGPYQGSLGCLEIPFGKGVCGTAAAERRTIIVPDVSRFPGHIACDARAKSEVVVPVFDRSRRAHRRARRRFAENGRVRSSSTRMDCSASSGGSQEKVVVDAIWRGI